MKRILFTLVLTCCLLCFLGGCTGNVSLPMQDESSVSVHLFARGGALEGMSGSTVTRTEPGEKFTANVALSTVQGNYGSLNGEYAGIWKATVSTTGVMTWETESGAAAPVYPKYGDYLYLVAYAPLPVQAPVNGTVTYTLTGQEDLLYTKELRGTKWDGGRFYGNTDSDKDQPLYFEHLLTRLSFKASKVQNGGPVVKIKRITVNGANNRAAVSLATGITQFSNSAGNAGLSLSLANGGIDITTNVSVTVGSLMLPPTNTPGNYTLTVETSVGTYENIAISYQGTPPAENLLQAGISHEIALSIADHELFITSITVNPWSQVDAGDVGIGDR